MKNQKLLLIILAFGATYILWGATYLFNKIAVNEIPPFLLAGIRFTSAAIIIFIPFLIQYKRITWGSPVELRNAAFAGFLFLTIGNGGVVWALQYVDSGFTALIIAAQPVVLLFFMRLLFRTVIKPKSWLGVILGITGIIMLVSQSELVHHQNQWIGIAIIFMCMISWGLGSLFVAKSSIPKNQFLNVGYQMLFGGVSLLIISWTIGEPIVALSDWSRDLIHAMIFLVVCGSILAYTAFNYLLKEVSPEKVATNTYVNPVVAVFLGWWVLAEPISIQTMMAAIVLLAGVYFVNTSKTSLSRKN